MGTTSDKLLYLQGTKEAIHDAIVAKGVSVPVGTPFRDYATKIGDITTGGGSTGSETADAWVRPTEWLALPDNVNGVQKVSILNAVFNTDSEFVAFTCAGAYTVDWGDGTTNNYATGVKAEHKYDYANANLNTATVTKFGYKQCIITITPQSGQNLTSVVLNTYHSSIGSSSASYNAQSGFLDLNINSANITNIVIGSSSSYTRHTMLEKCKIGQIASSISSLSYIFNFCSSLQSVEFGFDTTQITTWSSCFTGCYSLRKMPTINFRSAGVAVDSMFMNCYGLIEVPTLNITTIGSMASIFYNCYSLQKLILNITSSVNFTISSMVYSCNKLSDLTLTISGTGKVTSLSSTFSSCTSLKVLPAIDTSACTSFASAFNNTAIVTLPNYNYGVTTSLSSMCNSCDNLINVPDITVSSACANFSSLFSGCTSLVKAPNISGATGVTNVSSMFNNCLSLVNVPVYSFPAVTTTGLTSMFNTCPQLASVPAITFGSGVTSNATVLGSMYALKRMVMPLKFTFDISNAKMSATALNEMYSILPTVVGQTVTVTGNYGTTSDDPTIATLKGWTVVV